MEAVAGYTEGSITTLDWDSSQARYVHREAGRWLGE